jgi:hypothetical protein
MTGGMEFGELERWQRTAKVSARWKLEAFWTLKSRCASSSLVSGLSHLTPHTAQSSLSMLPVTSEPSVRGEGSPR